MIEIKDIKKYYNEYCVLNIPHLRIEKGESIGLVGNNGAGKTTLFSLVLDLIKASNGQITNQGIPVNESEDWKGFTTAFIDESFLIGYLSPEEYFYFIGELRGLNKEDVNHFLVDYNDFFNGEILNQRKYLRDLSKGNQKKIGIVAALIGNPELVILDEPFANLDPTTQIRLKKIIKSLTESKEKTFLISSHDLSHTVDVCDRIIALNKGEVVKDGPTSPDTLMELEAFFSQSLQEE